MTESSNLATITPRPGASNCDQNDCANSEMLALIEPDDLDEYRVLCPTHRVAYLREVYDR